MPETLKDKEILKIAAKMFDKYKLCDHCFGRVFAKVQTGLTNKKRGEMLRGYLKKDNQVKTEDCWLCEGLMDEMPHFANLILDVLKTYEFDTFLVGSKIDEEILEKEKDLFNRVGSEFYESIKNEINRETGKILEKKLDQEVDFERPTIMVVLDTAFDVVELQITSLFIYGRYKKFSRDIPQTRWFCKICRGKGCKKCDYTGKLYDASVEESVANIFLEKTKGDDESFHGCGREDVDVRMLGNGRPFVLEIKNPRIRNINLSKIEKMINAENKDVIEVSSLCFTDREEISRIKAASYKKIYRVILKCDKPINNEKLKKAAQSLRGLKIGQYTPSRVAHRRANMVREKHIYKCNVESVKSHRATLTLETESGTYIKELISGDKGRTKPSISEMIGVPCKVTQLDVIKIKGE